MQDPAAVTLIWSVPAPRTMADRVTHRLMEQITGESDTHVTALHAGYALGMTGSGVGLWPLRRFVQSAPGLTCGVTIPVPRRVNMAPYRAMVGQPIDQIQVVEDWTRGTPPIGTCVWLVTSLLGLARYPVPLWVQTPRHLKEFVRGEKYEIHQFE